MSDTRRESCTRRNLRLSNRDGGWYSVMWSLGESNIAVFSVALGFAPAVVGLLDTLPRLVGSLLQTVTPRAVAACGSHKRWMVRSATVQALTFIPLLIGALAGAIPLWLLFAVTAVYWASAWSCGNAWTTFISTVVPRRVRPAYFGQRNRWLNVIIVAGTLAGGYMLDLGRRAGHQLDTLALLFGVACIARLLSAMYLNLQTEPVPIPPGQRNVTIRELVGRYRHAPGGRLLIYRLAVEFALQVAAPFLIPFLLIERGLSHDYTKYGMVIAAQILAKAALLPLWGRVANIHGPRALLRLGGLAIVPVPLLWLFDDSFAYMLLVQALTGAALGAYELASFLLVFDAVPESERTSVMSRYNVAQFTVTFVASLVGAWLLRSALQPSVAAAVDPSAPGGDDAHAAGYVLVFAASTALRLLTLTLLGRVPQQIKPGEIPQTAARELPPLAGTFEQPVIPTHANSAARPAFPTPPTPPTTPAEPE